MKPAYRRMVRLMNEAKPRAGETAGGSPWHLYILVCADGTYYTGITTDPDRRLTEHNAGKASRYTRTRLPVTMAYREPCPSRAAALARECAVKAMGRGGKDRLVKNGV